VAHPNPPAGVLTDLLASARTIAVVGASSKSHRPSHRIFGYLKDAGYRVIPVNPSESEVLGEPAFSSLAEVLEPIDIVDVFRRPEHTPAVAGDAAAVGAGTLWLQQGISNNRAAEIASAAGLTVVMNLCIAVVHRQLGIPRRDRE